LNRTQPRRPEHHKATPATRALEAELEQGGSGDTLSPKATQGGGQAPSPSASEESTNNLKNKIKIACSEKKKKKKRKKSNQCRPRPPAALNNHNTRANARQMILGNNWLLKAANSGAGGPGGGIGSSATGGNGPNFKHCSSNKTNTPTGQASRARPSGQTSQAAKPAGQCSEWRTAQSGTLDNDDTSSTGTRQEGNAKNNYRHKPGQDQQSTAKQKAEAPSRRLPCPRWRGPLRVLPQLSKKCK